MTDHRTEHYKRSLGKLVASSTALKAFRKCEGDYGSAARATRKHRSVLRLWMFIGDAIHASIFCRCLFVTHSHIRTHSLFSQAYYDKEAELAELNRLLAISEKIKSDVVTGADRDKLQAKIKKAEADVAKAKQLSGAGIYGVRRRYRLLNCVFVILPQSYQSEIERATASFKTYTESMSAQLTQTTDDLGKRMTVRCKNRPRLL